jgi:hypothetical protein
MPHSTGTGQVDGRYCFSFVSIPTTTASRLKYSTMHPKTAIPPFKENFTAKGHHSRKR